MIIGSKWAFAIIATHLSFRNESSLSLRVSLAGSVNSLTINDGLSIEQPKHSSSVTESKIDTFDKDTRIRVGHQPLTVSSFIFTRRWHTRLNCIHDSQSEQIK